MNYIRSGILFLVLIFSLTVEAKEELVLIKAVSKTGRTFAIRRGSRDGITENQQSLFSSKNSSFAANAKVVNQDFSVWELSENRGSVSFEKGQFISFNNSIENVWIEIPKSYLAPKKELLFKQSSSWLIRTHYSYSMSESISEVKSEKNAGRTGFQFSAFYALRLTPHWELAGGIRIDRENSVQQGDISLDIPTQRTMGGAELTYHFDQGRLSDNNFYLSLAMAFGYSNTTVNGDVSAGTSLILPIAKFGYIKHLAPTYAMVFEGTIESIATQESFIDQNPISTNIVNAKIGLGLKF